jgi:hypothetical protein
MATRTVLVALLVQMAYEQYEARSRARGVISTEA